MTKYGRQNIIQYFIRLKYIFDSWLWQPHKRSPRWSRLWNQIRSNNFDVFIAIIAIAAAIMNVFSFMLEHTFTVVTFQLPAVVTAKAKAARYLCSYFNSIVDIGICSKTEFTFIEILATVQFLTRTRRLLSIIYGTLIQSVTGQTDLWLENARN